MNSELINEYAGAASKNPVSKLHYDMTQKQYQRHQDVEYRPFENRFNVYERKASKPVPKTRDRFIHNAFTQILQPKITEKKDIPLTYQHDKLNVRDISGTETNTYGRYKQLEGRDYMHHNDIAKSKPNQLKQNRHTNIPDYKLNCRDINEPKHVKFISNRVTDPLNPMYQVETQSRRHVIKMGQIEGSSPKLSKSPVTRRHINNISDIEGSHPKEMGSIPMEAKKRLTTNEKLPNIHKPPIDGRASQLKLGGDDRPQMKDMKERKPDPYAEPAFASSPNLPPRSRLMQQPTHIGRQSQEIHKSRSQVGMPSFKEMSKRNQIGHMSRPQADAAKDHSIDLMRYQSEKKHDRNQHDGFLQVRDMNADPSRRMQGSRRMISNRYTGAPQNHGENAYAEQGRHLQEITNSRRVNMPPDSKDVELTESRRAQLYLKNQLASKARQYEQKSRAYQAQSMLNSRGADKQQTSIHSDSYGMHHATPKSPPLHQTVEHYGGNPLQLQSSNSRQLMKNPNIAQRDLNPITHQRSNVQLAKQGFM